MWTILTTFLPGLNLTLEVSPGIKGTLHFLHVPLLNQRGVLMLAFSISLKANSIYLRAFSTSLFLSDFIDSLKRI